MDKAGLRIETTITEDQVKELIHHSTNDAEVLKFTSDPKRFKNRQAFNTWLQESPSLFILTNDSDKLLGIVWVQKMANPVNQPKFDTTAAIRLYGEARGKGLSRWFLNEGLKRYGDANYWLRTSSDNVSAIKTYEGLGFKIASAPDDENKIILTRHSGYISIQ